MRQPPYCCAEYPECLHRVEADRQSLRKQQARAVMPLIGPLIDEWDGLPNDVTSLPELKGLRRHMGKLHRAIEDSPPSGEVK